MKNKLIFYLERNRLYCAGGNLEGFLTLEIVPAAFSDLEIINRELFAAKLKEFVEQNKIVPAETIMVLSPETYFEKDIAQQGDASVDEATRLFLDNAPFEHIMSTTLTFDKVTRVVAGNKEIFDIIKQTLSPGGFTIVAVVPLVALALYHVEVGAGLNAAITEAIFKHFDALKNQNNMLFPESKLQKEEEETQESTPQTTQKTNNRLILMIGVFVVLLVVLGFMVFR